MVGQAEESLSTEEASKPIKLPAATVAMAVTSEAAEAKEALAGLAEESLSMVEASRRIILLVAMVG